MTSELPDICSLKKTNSLTPAKHMSEILDDLLLVIQSTISGVIDISDGTLYDNYLQYKIQLPEKSLLISLQYELNDFQDPRLPAVYDTTLENLGQYPDITVIQRRKCMFTKHSNCTDSGNGSSWEIPHPEMLFTKCKTEELEGGHKLQTSSDDNIQLGCIVEESIPQISLEHNYMLVPVKVELPSTSDQTEQNSVTEQHDQENAEEKHYSVKSFRLDRFKLCPEEKVCHWTPLMGVEISLQQKEEQADEQHYMSNECVSASNQLNNLPGDQENRMRPEDNSSIQQNESIQHQNTRRGKRLHLCKDYRKSFTHPGHLLKHQRTHTGKRPYPCSYCSKSFIKSYNLQIHEKNHPIKRPYSCSYCSKSFIRSDQLFCHQEIHTGYRPYSCRYCSRTFIRSYDLQRHEKIEHV